MKNIFLKLIVATTLAIASVSSFAFITDQPITGTIGFTGTSVTTVLDSKITNVSFVGNKMDVGTKTGTFASVSNKRATFFELLALTTSTGDINNNNVLWKVGQFNFTLTGILANEIHYGAGILVASGTISRNGYKTTAAQFTYTTQGLSEGTNSEETFSATAIPAPATIALLGLALVGFGAVRRKKQA